MHLVEPLPRQVQTTNTKFTVLQLMLLLQVEGAGLPKSCALGLLGIPGLTAYLGLMEAGKPKVSS